MVIPIGKQMNLFRDWTQRLRVAHGGAVAVEFAVLTPIILIFIAGTYDLSSYIRAKAKAQHVAGTLASLLADQNHWSKSEVDDLLSGGASMLRIYSASDLVLILSVIEVQQDGSTKVKASRGLSGKAHPIGSPPPTTVPEGIKETTSDLILSEVGFKFSTSFSGLWSCCTQDGNFVMSDYYFARPRRGGSLEVE